jgi:hypothetical protein
MRMIVGVGNKKPPCEGALQEQVRHGRTTRFVWVKDFTSVEELYAAIKGLGGEVEITAPNRLALPYFFDNDEALPVFSYDFEPDDEDEEDDEGE